MTSVSPIAGATAVNVGTDVAATFSEAMDAATVSTATFELRNAANDLIGSSVNYNAATNTATFNPTNDLAPGTTYTAKVKAGSAGAKDVAGNALATDFTWTFTTAAAPQP